MSAPERMTWTDFVKQCHQRGVSINEIVALLSAEEAGAATATRLEQHYWQIDQWLSNGMTVDEVLAALRRQDSARFGLSEEE